MLMTTAISMDKFEQTGLDKIMYDRTEKMDSMNKAFKSNVKPENGAYGTTVLDKGNGLTEQLSRNEYGHIRKDYFRDGQKYLTREKVSDGNWSKTHYDDNGTAYKTEHIKWGKSTPGEINTQLARNTEIVKGNFTAKTDVYGRPISNKVTDVQVKDASTGRHALSKNLYDSSYRPGDERGHIISDQLGGTPGKENVLAQEHSVNHNQFREVERTVERLKAEGHKVDYEVKTNYADKSNRPSSYEPKITVDGEPYELDASLKKIYNEESTTKLSEIKTSAKEKVQRVKGSMSESTVKAHETGRKAGIEAAAITCAISTVDNVTSYMDGEISADEMAINIAKDTGTAGAVGYGVGFVSSKVAGTMASSSCKMISALGKSSVPGAVVAFGVQSYGAVMDYAQGEIDGQELAYDLGENAVGVAGSIAGAAAAGAIAGSVVPVAGTVVGAAIGLVGGMVGYAVASGAYETAIELGSEYADEIGEKAQEVASATIDKAAELCSDVADKVTDAIKDFNIANKLPFNI